MIFKYFFLDSLIWIYAKSNFIYFKFVQSSSTNFPFILIEQANVPFREQKVPGREIWQMFLTDPNGVTIELNYMTTP